MEEVLSWGPYGRSSSVVVDKQLWKNFFRGAHTEELLP